MSAQAPQGDQVSEQPDLDAWKGLEAKEVLKRRQLEALEDGMSVVEARLFAESDIDIGDLRRLVKAHCPEDLLAKVLL